LFPPARNPWNTAHHPAGSSSGSGAAVAAGFAPATIGSDTGGSIRGPAAACGIAGLKPTYGLVSRRGVLPNCFSHDHVGPLAWTSEDVAIMLSIVAGHDPHDPGSADVPARDYAAGIDAPIAGTVIEVPWRWLEEEAPCAPETRAGLNAALAVFRDLGATIRGVEPPPLQLFNDAKKIIAIAELYSIHEKDLNTRPELCRRQPALSHHRGQSGPRRGLRSGDAGAPRPRERHAADLHDDRSDDTADRRAGRQTGARTALYAFHRPVLHDGIQRQRQSGVVGVQRLCGKRHAAIFADRRPAV
jgi:Asp-tRNA(Asn)/Glu-tRNA(Gln) amidotransferase A subunit family amidase